MPGLMSSIELLSTRELQACGAACLAKYFAAKGISSHHVDRLVAHLISLLTCTDLPAWESSGARLEFAGRGDPSPPELLAGMLPATREILERLTESVVEIGLVDMYGAETDEPRRFLARAIHLLESEGVRPPSLGELFPSRGSEEVRGWGPPVPVDQYEEVRRFCERLSNRQGGL
jgi:hypothetical protein